MPTTNQFFVLQQRLAVLLEANPYFTGLTAKKQILTEQIADLEFQVEHSLLPLGFGIVVTTAAGKPMENEYEVLVTIEDLNLSIIHNPVTDSQHNALDALAAAIMAVHGQSVQATAPHAPLSHDYFRVTGHQRRMDAPPHLHVHELHLMAGLRLL